MSCIKFDHWFDEKKSFFYHLTKKKEMNMSQFFYFRHVKGLISKSVDGENCVLATNHEDNFGVISTNTFTLSH